MMKWTSTCMTSASVMSEACQTTARMAGGCTGIPMSKPSHCRCDAARGGRPWRGPCAGSMPEQLRSGSNVRPARGDPSSSGRAVHELPGVEFLGDAIVLLEQRLAVDIGKLD